MICQNCHSQMIENPSILKTDEAREEQVIVFECKQCGHTEYQPLVTSFWRRLAA
jgi:RNase P subunit RPR2